MKTVRKTFAIAFCLAILAQHLLAQPEARSNDELKLDSSFASQLEEGMSSLKVEDRVQALDFIGDHMPSIPGALLSNYLLDGINDSSAKVRLAAIQTVNSDALRVARLETSDQFEVLLGEIVSKNLQLFSDSKLGEDDGKVFTVALVGLALLKYQRMSFPRYCEWEDDYLVKIIDMLQSADDFRVRCAASLLCGCLHSPNNLVLVINVLRSSLLDKSEEVKESGVITVLGFRRPDLFMVPRLNAYVALRPVVKGLADKGNGRVRILANEAIDALDLRLSQTQEKLGISITLDPSPAASGEASSRK